MWYVLTTLSTVGYGDCLPTTNWGKMCGTIIILCGFVTISLPITVLSSNFSLAYRSFLEARTAHLRQHSHNEAVHLTTSGVVDSSRTNDTLTEISGVRSIPSTASLTLEVPIGNFPHRDAWSLANLPDLSRADENEDAVTRE